MAKKVLLVDPPFHAFFEYNRWWYSYSCAQLAACLRERHIETYVYDGDKYFRKDLRSRKREEMVHRQGWYREGLRNDGHYIWKHFRETLSNLRPDVVGVATWTSKLQSTFKVLEIIKSFDRNIKTCVGGYHASAVPETFRDHALVDAVFTGSAEHTLPEWILNGCKKTFMSADPRSINVREIPSPDREALLFPEHYSASDMGMIMTSRGCPFDCTFCSNKLLSGLKYQHRMVEQVRKEIRHIIDRYAVDHLNVADANFLVNIRKSYEMAELFKSFGVTWSAEGKIDVISDEFLEKFIECGCTSLCFGIETGSNKGLNILNKRITVEQIERASKILHRHNIKWKCFFIVGFPHETLEDMEQTRSFALSLGASYLSLNSFTPLPGTEIYNNWASTFDSIPLEELCEYNQLNPKATFIKACSPEAYKKKFLSILADFEEYNRLSDSGGDFH